MVIRFSPYKERIDMLQSDNVKDPTQLVDEVKQFVRADAKNGYIHSFPRLFHDRAILIEMRSVELGISYSETEKIFQIEFSKRRFSNTDTDKALALLGAMDALIRVQLLPAEKLTQ